MSRRAIVALRWLAATSTVLAVTFASGSNPATAAIAEPRLVPLRVELDQRAVALGIGQGFGFTSTVTNDSDQPLSAVVAHLNIVSADGIAYVDPEDWSTRRTQYLDRLAPHSSLRLSWGVHAVNRGELVVYVAVTTRGGPDVVAASEPLRATVTAVRAIDAGGVLPIAIGVPLVLMTALALTQRKRRRLL